MRKILPILLFIITIPAFSQFNLTLNGVTVNDNDIILLDTYGYPQSNKSFHINNTTSGNIKARIKVTAMSNTDGSNLQICTNGLCYNGASVNSLFPPTTPMTIAASSFGLLEVANFDAGNGTDIIDYSLRVYQQDLNGNEIGTPINFTYRYNPNLGTPNFNTLQNIGIQIESTYVSQELVINATELSTVTIFDVSGKALVKSTINLGINSIGLHNVASGIYIATFTTGEGKVVSAKIMVK